MTTHDQNGLAASVGAANESLRQVLRTRRSAALKTLGEPGPSREQLDEMLTIASRVPDHAKLAPWRFIVIEGDSRRRLRTLIESAFRAANPEVDAARAAEAGEKLGSAPVIVAIVSSTKEHPKVPEWEQVLSAGAVGMNLLLAANALGFGAVWLTEWFGYDRRVIGSDGLGLSERERLAGFIHIGTEPGPREDRPRPVLADIVSRF